MPLQPVADWPSSHTMTRGTAPIAVFYNVAYYMSYPDTLILFPRVRIQCTYVTIGIKLICINTKQPKQDMFHHVIKPTVTPKRSGVYKPI